MKVYCEVEVVDCGGIFSLVTKIHIFLLSITLAYVIEFGQVDVKMIFLHVDLGYMYGTTIALCG